MIEINLAPRLAKKKKRQLPISFDIPNFPREAVIGLIGGLVFLLFLVHIVLTVFMALKFTQRTNLTQQLEKVDNDWKKAKVVAQELRVLQNKINAIEKITTEKRISWAHKLNDISDSLPRGVWLNKISLNRNILLLDGSAVSKEKNEMISVGSFLTNLKSRKSFTEGLENIDVSSIQRRQIRTIAVADFLITIKLP